MIVFNQLTCIGNVGTDPEVKTSTSDKPYARFRLAIPTLSSKEDEQPSWVTVIAWGNLAEQVGKLVKKGSLVLVSGRLLVREYTDKEKKQRTSVEVHASTVQILPRPEAKGPREEDVPVPEEEPEAV